MSWLLKALADFISMDVMDIPNCGGPLEKAIGSYGK